MIGLISVVGGAAALEIRRLRNKGKGESSDKFQELKKTMEVGPPCRTGPRGRGGRRAAAQRQPSRPIARRAAHVSSLDWPAGMDCDYKSVAASGCCRAQRSVSRPTACCAAPHVPQAANKSDATVRSPHTALHHTCRCVCAQNAKKRREWPAWCEFMHGNHRSCSGTAQSPQHDPASTCLNRWIRW